MLSIVTKEVRFDMDTSITQENMTKILLMFGEELQKKDQSTIEKMAILGEFATILIATIAATIGDTEEESLHAASLAYDDMQKRIKHIYECSRMQQH